MVDTSYPSEDDLLRMAAKIIDDPLLRDALAKAGDHGDVGEEDYTRLRSFVIRTAVELGYSRTTSDYFFYPSYALVRRILSGKIQGVDSTEARNFASRNVIKFAPPLPAHVREIEVAFSELISDPESIDLLKGIMFYEVQQQTEEDEESLAQLKENFKQKELKIARKYGFITNSIFSTAIALARMFASGEIESFDDDEAQELLKKRADPDRVYVRITFEGDSNV